MIENTEKTIAFSLFYMECIVNRRHYIAIIIDPRYPFDIHFKQAIANLEGIKQ